MKAFPTVIYDVSMGGMVTRPVGCADLRSDGRELADASAFGSVGEMRGPGECISTTHLQESVFTRLRLMEMSLC